MDAAEVAARCEMTLDAARLAMRARVRRAVRARRRPPDAVRPPGAGRRAPRRRLTRGDRFFHIIGTHDKARGGATAGLALRRAHGARSEPLRSATRPTTSADAGARRRRLVDRVSPQAAGAAARVPGARRRPRPGPAGLERRMLETALAALHGDGVSGPPALHLSEQPARQHAPHRVGQAAAIVARDLAGPERRRSTTSQRDRASPSGSGCLCSTA